MKKFVLIISFLFAFSGFLDAEEILFFIETGNDQHISKINDTLLTPAEIFTISEITAAIPADTSIKKEKRIIAVILTILTGPLGGHRLYLGTSPVVPVVYAVTLGGGCGLLPLIDLLHLLFSKRLEPYKNNPKIFMWIGGSKTGRSE
ncbi:MAG: NINE protein [Bacteroidota bacterium]